MKQHTKEAAALVLYFILITLFVLYFAPNKVLGHFLYFIVPSLFLVIRHWKTERHVIMFTTLTGLAIGLVLETVSYVNHLWQYKPDFPFMHIRDMPMEAIIWYAMWVGLTVSIYRTFFDPHRHRIALAHRPFYAHKHFLFVITSILAVYVFVLSYQPDIFMTSYAYAKYGTLLFVIPIIYALVRHPKLTPKIFKFTLALFGFALTYELVGLHVGWWSYSSNFLFTFTLGTISFSVEELVLWIILGSAFVASFWEEYETDLR